MKTWLKWYFESFKKSIVDKGANQISYTDKDGKYQEYTEWYAFRESAFNEKVFEILNKPYFEKIFYIVLSAILSSNNEEQFLNLLDKYLSAFLAKKLTIYSDDFEERKYYIMANLNFINDNFLKHKLQIEQFDWSKYNNWDLNSKEYESIFSIVDYVYSEIESKIFSLT
jgi:hypothetical protein